MPKGLKQTSSQIVISFSATEANPNSLTSERIDLQLNALDNEVFVVTGVKMDLEAPDFDVAATGLRRSATFATVSKQDISNAPTITLANPSIFASDNIQVVTNSDTRAAGDSVNGTYAIQTQNTDTPAQMEYVDIIATPDFYVNVNGVGNTSAKSVDGKLYGYRARADASIYASLVQSELLSA